MKTDIIIITNTGKGLHEAMEQAAAAGNYRGLGKKEALRLRLLAEEMLGMFREITGEIEGEFWLESEGKRFELHLCAHPNVTGAMRDELLAVSSTGKNAAAVGVMGKLRELFESAFAAMEMTDPASYYTQGLLSMPTAEGLGPMAYNASVGATAWSMQKYKATVAEKKDDESVAKEEWDELEKSIVANLADEVRVAIRGREVEMVVYKNFEKQEL